ncbi:hypothetical protein DPEC_G00218890 [Dallia pectoralis]|uniref:Uncharacterized protein n=1 Tax=Dallia pectoralis TaxID=75939 RepID=A0ACC2G3H7_DALPE|nr:hypothetical protein DPEC_G00218890 [Dallia pectoralis]
MASSSSNQSAYAGLKNTLKFQWKVTGMMERFVFGKKVLFEILKLTADDVYCLQQNGVDKFLAVTFYTIIKLEEVRVLCKAKATSLAALGIDVESMCTHNQRALTVPTYSPFVSDEILVHYLSRYTTVMPGV